MKGTAPKQHVLGTPHKGTGRDSAWQLLREEWPNHPYGSPTCYVQNRHSLPGLHAKFNHQSQQQNREAARDKNVHGIMPEGCRKAPATSACMPHVSRYKHPNERWHVNRCATSVARGNRGRRASNRATTTKGTAGNDLCDLRVKLQQAERKKCEQDCAAQATSGSKDNAAHCR